MMCLLQGAAAGGPKNIILCIGDGMGAGQLTAARYVKGALEMERCPVGGLLLTHSADQMVTDSAASGTAISTGYKTSNGTIGQTPEGIPLKTALEAAEEKGKATGLVCTSSVTHATPAAFAAHVKSRKMEPAIAEQLAAAEIEVLFGGGLGFFLPGSAPGSLRPDENNLLQTLTNRMTVVTTADGFESLETPERAAGLFASNALPRASEGRIPLSALTAKAIEILDQNDGGFFLMVEGSQIDWACHANDSEYLLSELLDFDEAVGVALDFAGQDGQTLVIVTADHETGGFTVLDGSVDSRMLSRTSFAGKSHSAAMVPLLAFGTGAETFGGIRDNTDVGRMIMLQMGQHRPPFYRRFFGWIASPFH
jgi:alkaline phosphatase